eukprot:1180317-Prorocentrum_minimum.AAC.1
MQLSLHPLCLLAALGGACADVGLALLRVGVQVHHGEGVRSGVLHRADVARNLVDADVLRGNQLAVKLALEPLGLGKAKADDVEGLAAVHLHLQGGLLPVPKLHGHELSAGEHGVLVKVLELAGHGEVLLHEPVGAGGLHCRGRSHARTLAGRLAGDGAKEPLLGGIRDRQPAVDEVVELEVRRQPRVPTFRGGGALTNGDQRLLGAVAPHQLVGVALLQERHPDRHLLHVPKERLLGPAGGAELHVAGVQRDGVGSDGELRAVHVQHQLGVVSGDEHVVPAGALTLVVGRGRSGLSEGNLA